MRFRRLEVDELTGEAARLARRVMAVSGDGLGGPFNLLLRSPKMGHKMMDLLGYFNDETRTLDPRCRRLAVLVLARAAGATYAWWTHRRRALRLGEFTEVQIDAINDCRMPKDLLPKQAAVWRFVTELIGGGTTDAAFAALRDETDEAEIVELIVLCGTYTTVAMLLREGQSRLPAGEEDTLRYD